MLGVRVAVRVGVRQEMEARVRARARARVTIGWELQKPSAFQHLFRSSTE